MSTLTWGECRITLPMSRHVKQREVGGKKANFLVNAPGSGEIFRALVLNLFWSSVGRLVLL